MHFPDGKPIAPFIPPKPMSRGEMMSEMYRLAKEDMERDMQQFGRLRKAEEFPSKRRRP